VHGFGDPAFGANKSLPVHRWVPWIAGFSSAFAARAIARRLARPGVVLDPFCGVGTTLVEAARLGHAAVGFEINPWAALAARTKANAVAVDPEAFAVGIERFRAAYAAALASAAAPRSRPPAGFRTRAAFFSPRVLHKVLTARDCLAEIADPALADLFRVAFGATLVGFSNYSYEPSLGQRKSAGRAGIDDHPVGETLAAKLDEMAEDVRALRRAGASAPARVVQESFFRHEAHLAPGSVDLVLTSPPYLNNYHYNRNTRPQLYWLGLVEGPGDLKPLEEANFGTYWQTARERERVDLELSPPGSELPERIGRLRGLNAGRGVYGGNGWANYAAAYFNDCRRFALGLARVLRPGGAALVVVGNSILQGIAFPTDRHLAEIAAACGLEVVGIHVPRSTRVGNSIIQSQVRAGRARDADQLYEAVVELRRP
jgi:DNA modification methylase